MCGIAGYFGSDTLKEAAIQKCLGLMHHRGPDHATHRHWVNRAGNNVYFLHSRLSIIDLDPRAQQPFRYGATWMIYNGELYNYLELRQELAGRGQEVTIVCQRCACSVSGAKICEVGERGLTRKQRLDNFIDDACKELVAGQYEFVHAMLPFPGVDVYQPRGGTVPAQALSRKRKHGPMGRFCAVVEERLRPHRRLMQNLERAVARDPNTLILAVSRMVQGEFCDYYGREEGVKVVHNGVGVPAVSGAERQGWREEKRTAVGAGKDAILFLTVANNFTLKGVGETIASFARWVNRNGGRKGARLVIVGGDRPGKYARQARKEGICEQVIFAGPTEQIFGWYAAADACILLSWYDPCSRVVLEAARWGLPSITTVYNGAAEIAGGGVVVVKSPEDVEGIVAGLDELADAEKRRRRADNCRRITKEVSIEHHVEQLLGIYIEMKG